MEIVEFVGGSMDGHVEQRPGVRDLPFRYTVPVKVSPPRVQYMRLDTDLFEMSLPPDFRTETYLLSKRMNRWYYVEEGLVEMAEDHQVDPRPQSQ